MNNSIIDILNKDPKVKQLMRTAQQVAIKQGITPEEWKARDVYNKINNIK